MKEETERKSKPGYEKSYWCCAADFGSHESDCPNGMYVAPAPTASATRYKVKDIFVRASGSLEDEYVMATDHAAEIERLSKERDDLVRLIKASPNLDRKWGEEDLYACVNICLNALFWRKEEVERLSRTIEIQRKIRAYVAFVLAGDELADVQMAADKTMEKLEAAESKLSQLQLALGELLAHDGDSGSEDFDAAKLMAARAKLAILNGGQQ